MLSRIIDFVKGKPVITVSDTPGFCDRGVHINFAIVPVRGKATVKFEVNESAIKFSGFIVSWHFFEAAIKIVQPQENNDIK
jgi:hypothetical protein